MMQITYFHKCLQINLGICCSTSMKITVSHLFIYAFVYLSKYKFDKSLISLFLGKIYIKVRKEKQSLMNKDEFIDDCLFY